MIPMKPMKVKERGTTPRRLLKVANAARKTSWFNTGQKFHQTRRDLRFTPAHGKKARYGRRSGEGLPRGSKQYRRSYTGQKESRFGHTNPMQYTGRTRRAVVFASISATGKGVAVRYPGARVLNFKNPRSRFYQAEEFRRFTAEDNRQMIAAKDKFYEVELRKNTETAEIKLLPQYTGI